MKKLFNSFVGFLFILFCLNGCSTTPVENKYFVYTPSIKSMTDKKDYSLNRVFGVNTDLHSEQKIIKPTN